MEGATIQNYLGRVTQVIDPENFWMQIGTDESLAEFLQFEITVENYCRTLGSSPEIMEEVTMGQTLLVDCTEDGHMWRRGQVSRIDKDNEEVDVFYLDYGETELVDLNRLCINFPEHFICFPAQAVKCCLAGIKPIARQWTSRAIKSFQELVEFDIFQTVVLGFLPGNYKVSLYTQNGDDGRSLAYQLLDEELALPSDDDVAEFYRDAPKHFQSQSVTNGEGYVEWNSENTEDANEDWPQPCDSSADASSSSEQHSSSHLIDTPQYGAQPSKVQGLQSSSTDTAPSFSSDDENEDGGVQMSPGIPNFDFGQIHKTEETSTDKLKQKDERHAQRKLEKEYERLKGELEEQAKLAAAVGYGGKHEVMSSGSEDETVESKVISSKQTMEREDTTKNSQTGNAKPEMVNNNHPVRRYGPRKKELPPRFQKLREQRERNVSPEHREPDVSQDNPLASTSKPRMDRNDKRMRDIPPRFQKAREQHQEDKHAQEQTEVESSTQQEISREGTIVTDKVEENTSPEESPRDNFGPEILAQIQEISPTKVNFLKVMNQIFSQINKEDLDITSAKLRSLFATDLFVYLDKDQLEAVINILLNRAVRHYGDIHDVLLEILELLKASTEDFESCILPGLKKIQDMYVKVQVRGSPFHVQCAKILGHIFILSLFWDNCAESVQNCIFGSVEKWIYFNKKGTQTGQEELEEVYLICFKTVWDIISHVLKDRFQEKIRSLQWEFKDKIFGANVARSIKEQLFDLYLECFVSSGSEVVQNSVVTQSTACQTNSLPIPAYQAESQENCADAGKLDYTLHCQNTRRYDDSHDALILMSPRSFEGHSLLTPGSTNSSVYFTPNANVNTSDFPALNQFSSEGTSAIEKVIKQKSDVPESLEKNNLQKSWVEAVTSSSTPKELEKSKLRKPVSMHNTHLYPDSIGDSNTVNPDSIGNSNTMNIDSIRDSNTMKPPFKIYNKFDFDEKLAYRDEKEDLDSFVKDPSVSSGRSAFRNTLSECDDPLRKPLNLHTIMTDMISSSTETKECNRSGNNRIDTKPGTCDKLKSQDHCQKNSCPKDRMISSPRQLAEIDLHRDNDQSSDSLLNDRNSEPIHSQKSIHKQDGKKKAESSKPVDWWSLGVDEDDDDEDDDALDLAWPGQNNYFLGQNNNFLGEDEEDHVNVILGDITLPPELNLPLLNKQIKPPPGFAALPVLQQDNRSQHEINSSDAEAINAGDKSISDSDPAWETLDEDDDNSSDNTGNNEHSKNQRVPSDATVIHESVNLNGVGKSESQQRTVAAPQRTESPCWQPGPRRCTRCGETTHTIYNCPDKAKSFFFS